MSESERRRNRPGAARRPISRRRFMTLLAAGSAAALTAPARGLVAATAPPAKTKLTAPSPRMLAEIEKQKKVVADTLKVIRSYPLPPGSDMAFEFRPLRAKRRK
ncbi:MAG: hypothetical protein AAB113_09425 [Candidatus Eisenbacteria bacterium]